MSEEGIGQQRSISLTTTPWRGKPRLDRAGCARRGIGHLPRSEVLRCCTSKPTAGASKLAIRCTSLEIDKRTKLSFTRRNTVADRSTRVRIPPRSDETSTNEALESATSLPDPIAIATSAAARAYHDDQYSIKDDSAFVLTGASLIPSPTMATTHRLFNLLRNNHPNFVRCFFGEISWSQRTLSA